MSAEPRNRAVMDTALFERAAHLKTLEKDWDSYGGEPLDHATVDKAVELALALADQFPSYPPQLVPCSDGSRATAPHECQRCNSDEWSWCDYRGCSDCFEPEPELAEAWPGAGADERDYSPETP